VQQQPSWIASTVKAQAVRQLALLNNNRSRAHKVHDADEEQPANYSSDMPFVRLPLSAVEPFDERHGDQGPGGSPL
jgi:hypothetical protein